MSEPQDKQAQRNQAVLNALGGPPLQPSWPAAPGQPLNQEAYPAAVPGNPFVKHADRGRWPLVVWVFLDALLALVLAIVLQFGLLAVFIAINNLSTQAQIQDLQNDPVFTLLASPTLGISFALMAALRVRWLRKLPWSWFNLNRHKLLATVGWGVAAGFAFLIVNALTSFLFQQAGSVPDQSEQIAGPFKNAAGWQIALLGVFIVLIGPFLEEFFFRGYAFRAFQQRFGPVWGVVLSGALFSVPHALSITEGFLGLLVPIFFGGMILAYVYYRTGNLWSAVIAHAINNFIGFLGLLILLQQ